MNEDYDSMKSEWRFPVDEHANSLTLAPVVASSQIRDESTLRAKARELIQAGKLPNRRPERTWGGPGEGTCCTVCSAPLKQDEVEFEIEFARDGNDPGLDKYHVHVHCYSAWELECRTLELAREGALPGKVDDGKIARHGCDPTHKRGPA